MPPVTLREIAERIGCTRATVSYALRNHPQISAATRRRVQAAARRLGWAPDAELTRQMALVRARTRQSTGPSLAIIVNRSNRQLAVEWCPRLQLIGARRRAAELGYHADVFNLIEAPLAPARLAGILSARGVRGVIFIGTTGQEHLPPAILQIGKKFASAVTGVTFSEPPFHAAVNDIPTAARFALLELARLGFRRPGTVLPNGLDLILRREFSGGIAGGFQDLPDSARVEICFVGRDANYLPEEDYARVHGWLRRNRPDALLTTDVHNLAACLQGADRAHRALPIFALDWVPELELAAGGVDARAEDVGESAVDLVVDQINRGEFGLPRIQKVVKIESGWRLRPDWQPLARR